MDRVNAASWAAWKRLAGERVRLFNAYGPAESGPTTTIYEAGESRWEGSSFVPIGTPIANARVYVLDPYGNLCPAGVAGELFIGGCGIARGYRNAADLSAAKFIPDPFSGDPSARLYRTGDFGFALPDGNLVFLGRVDRQVKIRGYRVEPEEIEAALACHAKVSECAVVPCGENAGRKLVAFLTLRAGQVLSPGELRRDLSRRLPEWMVPSAFVILDAMPLSPNGKIDRQTLAARDISTSRGGGPVEFSTDAERRLGAIWRRVLGSSPAGTMEDFFEAGGDSLAASKLAILAREEFGRELPFAEFLRRPTIANAASLMEEGSRRAEAAPAGHRVPPLFCVSSCQNDSAVFRNIAKDLPPDQPLFVHSVPVSGRGDHCSVEAIASRLCESIRSAEPHGPYILGGYCFGGLAAYEAARQLLASGEEVLLVALFDTPAPGCPPIPRSRRYAHHLNRWVRNVAAGRYSSAARDAATHWNEVRARARTKTAGIRFGARASANEGENAAGSLIAAAARAYVPSRIAADVAQFIAADDPCARNPGDDPRLAWRDLCDGEFRLFRMPGRHDSWFREPHAQAATELLSEALRWSVRLRESIVIP